MAQQRQRYSFADVGESVEQFKATTRVFENTVPLNIATPIRLDNSKKQTFVMHYNFVKSTKDNLRNLLNTNFGERLMFPNYGANIQELAWEVGTEDGDLRIMGRIKKAVQVYMPYIALDGYEPIRKKQTTGEDKIGVRLFFIIPGFDDTNVHGVEVYLNVSG